MESARHVNESHRDSSSLSGDIVAVDLNLVDESRSVSNDSGYDETVCSTDSVRSSIYQYEEKYGRTYHAFHPDKYYMPNDEGEKERMDIHYHALRISMENKLFYAPLNDPKAVLDVGTGTGIWAMDAADTFPGSEIVGFDISPIQPTWVPPNLQFEVLDADDTWGYQKARSDLVHTRIMNGFGIRSWPHFYQEAWSCLKPGGWVENQEFDCEICCDDGTLPEESTSRKWATLWNQATEMIGRTARCYPEVMAEQMRDVGFVNVQVLKRKMPIGPWPKDKQLKEASLYGMVALLEGVHGMSVKLFRTCHGWSDEELELFLVDFRKELKTKSIHSYWPT